MPYQDVETAGGVVKGDRECESRWEMIRPFLAEYTRPFTLLDIGAAEGYFSLRAVQEFDNCTAVMVEGTSTARTNVEWQAAQGQAPRVVVLEHRVSVEELERLADCEHLDVVLALNVLHHFPASDAGRAFDAVARMGDRVIVETPPKDDVGACGQAAIPVVGERLTRFFSDHYPSFYRLGTTASHTSDVERTMYALAPPARPTLARAYIKDSPIAVSEHRIVSTTSTKTVEFTGKGEPPREWRPGINLQTYLSLGGVWPPRQRIAGWLRNVPLPHPPHGDIRPWNFVLDGEAVHLIDGRDDRAVYDDAEGLAGTVYAVSGEG